MKGIKKQKFIEDDIEIIIEIPEVDEQKNNNYIEDIKTIMNNEMLLQLNR